MRKKAIIACAVLLGSAACDQDLCADGAYGTVVLGSQGFVVEGPKCDPFGCTDEVVAPYSEGSPFESCTSIGSLFVRDLGAMLESDQYPNLKELGGIVVEPSPTDGTLVIPFVDGFDGLTVFGGVSDTFGRTAPVGDIAGFRSLERISGPLLIVGEVDGMRNVVEVEGNLLGLHSGLSLLQRIGGDLTIGRVRTSLDAPSLIEVGGDVTITRIRDIPTLGIPSLQRIGGDVLVEVNSMTTWAGFAPRAHIGGALNISGNRGITNQGLYEWLEVSGTTFEGAGRFCNNSYDGFQEGEERECDDFEAQAEVP